MSTAKRQQRKVPRFEELSDWVTPEQGRAYLQLSRSSMYARLKDGSIPSKFYGRQKLIPRMALKPPAA